MQFGKTKQKTPNSLSLSFFFHPILFYSLFEFHLVLFVNVRWLHVTVRVYCLFSGMLLASLSKPGSLSRDKTFGRTDLLSLACVAGSLGVLGLWTRVGRGALCRNRSAEWGRGGKNGAPSLCAREKRAGLLAQWKVTRANVKWLERWSPGPGVLIAKRRIWPV